MDFEPIKAKAEGARRFPGMSQRVFDGLATRLLDSQAGPIPQGWEPAAFGAAADLSKAQVNPQDYPAEVFDHFSIPAFDEGQGPQVETGSAIKSNKFLVVENCVLVSKLNPRIPRVWLPPRRGARRQIASTEFLVTVPRAGWTREYLYFQCQQPAFRDALAQNASGTSNSHQRARPQNFLASRVVLPPPDLRAAFQSLAEPMMQLGAVLQSECLQLAELRDLLLPKLLAGELRTTDLGGADTRPL